MVERTTPVTTSVSPISAGRVLGDKFEVTGVLGEGGTGIVYEAYRLGPRKDGGEPDKQPIALKVIHGHLLTDKQIRGRFTREAAILRRLEGPNLCPILDFGELSDPKTDMRLLFIALPRIEGPPLDQLLREKSPLPIERVVDIASQICTALTSAHGQGVIHRDLKPANVILEGGKKAIVVDFGMAKIVTGAGTESTALTQQNMVFGTPEYMAPEQARGDELDARCDIYALGIMLYEMLCGKVPFKGASPLTILTAHLTEPPMPPRARSKDRGISLALEAVVMHALAKDPSERYATAKTFQSALAHALESPDDVDRVAPNREEEPAKEAPADVGDTLTHGPTLPAPEPGAPSSRTPMSARRPTPTSTPPRSNPRGTTSRPPTPVPDSGRRRWMLVWVAAIAVGLAIGVWLSLRVN